MASKETIPVDSEPETEMQEPEPSEETITTTISHHGRQHTYTLPPASTITDLTNAIHAHLSIDPSHMKFIIPRLGVLKPPYPDPVLPLAPIATRKTKIQLLAPTPSDLKSLSAPTPRPPPPIKAATPARTRDPHRTKDEALYTFHKLVPIPYLPQPERSLRFLERLRDDAGIKAAMRAHKFSVPVLTEMNPAEHTTHESRTLGLNRNRGEIIELRLRTDAYDGYRDYKVIRKTLCHELAHNVWGEHDRNFWDLTKEIEGEVERGDWRSGGRTVGAEEFYNPDDEGSEHVDGGGWTGGDFVLGGKRGEEQGLSRREVLARAAEERMRRQEDQEGGSRSS
ncbi:MAG: hypothetical protein MMC23_000424 [Stictis urceolatum]|nr:hypothetical protein [Stictis urceolata]